MRRSLFIVALVLMTMFSSCNGFSSEEKELINSGDKGVMRVLESDVPEDMPVLRAVAKEVSAGMMDTDEFRLLCKRMLMTVKAPENDGVGIAAPQVGISRRVIAVQRLDKVSEPFELYVNPVILSHGLATAPGAEGCLSVPGLRGTVERYQEISVSYQTVDGVEVTEDLSGYIAIIFQHEIDHLDGILYTDKAMVLGNEYMETRVLDGGAKMTWIQDNAEPRFMARGLFVGADDALVESLGLQDGIPASVSVFLLEKDGLRILFDAGNGVADSRLPAALTALGLGAEDIDYVYLTHLHGDHVGGMLNGSEAAFPVAKVYMSQAEFDSADGRNRQLEILKSAYEGRMNFFSDGDVLPGEVKAIAAHGHTPGHTVFETGNYIVVGDIMHGVALQTVAPEACASFDGDKPAAIRSRKMVLEYAVDNQLFMAGMHFPSPGILGWSKLK